MLVMEERAEWRLLKERLGHTRKLATEHERRKRLEGYAPS